MSFSFISYCEKKICAHLKIDDFLSFTAINFISAHFLNREPKKHRSGLDFWYKHVQVIFHIQNLYKPKHVILSQDIMLFSCSAKNSEGNNSKLQNAIPLPLGYLWFILVMYFTVQVFNRARFIEFCLYSHFLPSLCVKLFTCNKDIMIIPTIETCGEF